MLFLAADFFAGDFFAVADFFIAFDFFAAADLGDALEPVDFLATGFFVVGDFLAAVVVTAVLFDAVDVVAGRVDEGDDAADDAAAGRLPNIPAAP